MKIFTYTVLIRQGVTGIDCLASYPIHILEFLRIHFIQENICEVSLINLEFMVE